MLERLRKFILVFLWVLVGAFFVFVFLPTRGTPAASMSYGVTFTPSYARYLGLNWQRLYLAILDDLGVRQIRLSAHWDDIEPVKGQWDFRELDWEVVEASKRGARVVLAVGRKLPRWPECRVPAWAKAQEPAVLEQSLLLMLETVVTRYRAHPAVSAWQVENEPFFSFGNCSVPSLAFYRSEIETVRRLDPSRPILATDSGELGSWISLAREADGVGVSMYQMTWNPIIGYFSYPVPPAFYRRKSSLVRWATSKSVFLSELQMEPWLPDQSIHNLPYSELEKSFTIERFRNNLRFARDAGFDIQYLWGVEWWAWAVGRGHPEFWEAAQKLFKISSVL